MIEDVERVRKVTYGYTNSRVIKCNVCYMDDMESVEITRSLIIINCGNGQQLFMCDKCIEAIRAVLG